jgi:hyperosmotically inducible protein
MKKTSIAFAVAAAMFSVTALADTPDKNAVDKQYKADMAKVKADFKSAKKSCEAMKGAEEKACDKQAKADHAKAEADVKNKHKQAVADLKAQKKS